MVKLYMMPLLVPTAYKAYSINPVRIAFLTHMHLFCFQTKPTTACFGMLSTYIGSSFLLLHLCLLLHFCPHLSFLPRLLPLHRTGQASSPEACRGGAGW